MGLGHGYVDFAGSTVVHAVGGFCAMALAVILGPRLGKYAQDGKPVAFPAHNLVFVVTGTFILLFGWMGFNPGSTLGATDLRISVVAVNTNLAAVAGFGVGAARLVPAVRKPDITMACNGMLAGLVAITAPCAFVSSDVGGHDRSHCGRVVCGGVLFNERVLKVDDPCGAISVHGFCGWFGAVAVGIFADGTYGAGWNGVGASSYLGAAGQGCHRPPARRRLAVPGAARRRDALRRLCVWFHLSGVFRRECRPLDARQPRGRARRAGRAAVRHGGLPGGRRAGQPRVEFCLGETVACSCVVRAVEHARRGKVRQLLRVTGGDDREPSNGRPILRPAI